MPIPSTGSLDPDSAWRQIVARDSAGEFFYGVITTGVFCRPGCASRLPLRAHVRLFADGEAARAAGFRPCKRCKPTAPAEPSSTAAALDQVRAYLEKHYDRRVRLEELGQLAALSPFTVQRAFKRAMGVSPLAYQRALRAGRLRGAIREGQSVTEAIYGSGFSSTSRAYDGAALGMTPTRFAQGGKGERIGWCSAHTRFGWVIAGATGLGLCWLSLAGSEEAAEMDLRSEFPAAEIRRDESLSRWIEAALKSVSRDAPLIQSRPGMDSLDIRGTVFQLRVWQALRKIPCGETRTYSQLAREMGEPRATRAVARACAMNRVALMVPCHRVVGADGSLTGYRWGVGRKRALLAAEKG